jgi:hypothetical protein
MRLKQESRLLKRKALTSLTWAVEAFNSPHGEGRATRVLLHAQHSFEMLLKAALVQLGERVFDKETGRSIGFKKCVGIAAASTTIKLNDADAGTLRAIDAMRDDEQHWFNQVPEQLLYLHARAAITLFDEVLQRVLDEQLASHLPTRVLPLSVDPPQDLGIVLDREYTQIASLLQPGRRQRHEARARIRTLLAMEAHVEPDAAVSSADVDRVERGIRKGNGRAMVFPRLDSIATAIDGEGLTVTVHFTKKQGAAVRYVADESVPAAAVRQVDLQKKFHLSATDLAEAVNLTRPVSLALRDHLGVDQDESCIHEFKFGSQRHIRFSDNALRRMQEVVDTVDMHQIWDAHKHTRGGQPKPPCPVAGCSAAS